MITRAILRYIRITPRKFRQIIPLVKGRNPEEAIAILTGVKKKASGYCIDLINSAIANTKRIQGVEVSKLCISKLTADGGPQLKRFRAGSMGRAGMIRKRTSHITLELDEMPVKMEGHVKEEGKPQKSKHPAEINVKEKAKGAAQAVKHEKHGAKKTAKKGKE